MNQTADRASRLAELVRLHDGNEAMAAAYANAPIEEIDEAIADARAAEADRGRLGSRMAAVWSIPTGGEEVA